MIRDMVRLTLTDPRAAMTALLALRVPQGTALQLLLLGAVLSALSTWAVLMVQPMAEASVPLLVLDNPFVFAVSATLVALLLAFSLFRVGLALGGQGDLTGAMLLTGWLQVMLVILQVGEILIAVALPGAFALLASIAALGLIMWIAVSMTAVLHGFSGVGTAVATLAGAFVLMTVGLAVIAMVMAGLAGGGGNV